MLGVPNAMSLHSLIENSARLAAELRAMLEVALFDDTRRIDVSNVACSMSIEHWDATRELLSKALLPSALVVHRAQFEALVRSVWVLYAADDHEIEKLSAELSSESEQAAKNLPQVATMMGELLTKGPSQAYDALNRFKENSWKALNSHVHAGVHPLRRHAQGYPLQLVDAVLRNANGLAILAGMQRNVSMTFLHLAS